MNDWPLKLWLEQNNQKDKNYSSYYCVFIFQNSDIIFFDKALFLCYSQKYISY